MDTLVEEVLVFKTSVSNTNDAERIKPLLDSMLKNRKWNFDLDDCDNILRIETDDKIQGSIISLLNLNGFDCVELE